MDVVATLLRILRQWWEWLLQWFRQRTGQVVTLDTGKRVVMGQKIAEGGFSFVFEAFDADTSSVVTKYALKRVHCPDMELLSACRREAAAHRAVEHAHLMPLLGFAWHKATTDCFLLFPYCTQSLRDAVHQRNPYLQYNQQQQSQHQAHNRRNISQTASSTAAPWPEAVALRLFGQICRGVLALHEHNYSHRDIKLENILLLDNQKQQQQSHPSKQQMPQYLHPVLMDFGSAGAVTAPVATRRDALEIVEQAAQYTTMPYRPPELFDGGILQRPGPDVVLDYRAVDVWSLGCTLHALLYGASPFECDYSKSGSSGNGNVTIRIVECTHLAILGNKIPTPPPASPMASWYSTDIRRRLVEPMLTADRWQRPTLATVVSIVDELLQQTTTSGTDNGRNSSTYSDVPLSDGFYPHFTDRVGTTTERDDGIALLSRAV